MRTATKLLLGLLGGVRAFSPLSIPGLALWLDASDGATLFQDSAGTAPAAADSDVVGYWADKSGNGRHATQSTTARKPTLKLAQQNGRAVVRCDGSDDYLLLSNASGIFRNRPYGYVFAAYRPNQTALATRRILLVPTPAGTERMFLSDGITANRYTIQTRRTDADARVTVTGTVDHGGLMTVITAITAWASQSITLRQNGAQTGTGSYASAGNTSDTSYATVALSSAGSVDFSIGDFAELLVYMPSTAMTAANITAVESYLNAKWAVY